MQVSQNVSRLIAGLSIICAPIVAQATAIFDNFGPGNSHGDLGHVVQGEDVHTIGDVDQAAQFKVGALDQLVTSVTLGIWATQTGPMDILITKDVVGVGPGSVLRTLPIMVNSEGKQTVTAFDDGSLILNANTKYWVVADGKDSFDGSWTFNSIGDMGFTAGRTNNGPWNLRTVDELRFALSLESTPVPEPASAVLLGMGAMSLLRRRR